MLTSGSTSFILSSLSAAGAKSGISSTSHSALESIIAAASQTANALKSPVTADPAVSVDSTSLASPLRLTATIAALVLIPLLSSNSITKPILEKNPKLTWFIAFAINLIAVSLPGRFDNSRAADSTSEGGPWNSIFAPAGWAFAIWAVIYLSELFLVAFASSPFNSNRRNAEIYSLLAKAAPAWLAGNLFQSLWCVSFRSALRQVLWLPALCLAGAAFSMIHLHGTFSSQLQAIQMKGVSSLGQQVAVSLLRFPVALHAGWLAAATLLNINGWVAYRKASTHQQLALAFASVYGAGALALLVGIPRGDPFFIGTIAWAAAGLADKMRRQPPTQLADPVALLALGDTEALASQALLVMAGVVGLLQIAKNVPGLAGWIAQHSIHSKWL